MAKEERRLYPSRHGKDEARLLAFARRAAAVLSPGFDPPDTRVSLRSEDVPYDHSVEREKRGTKEAGFEIENWSRYVEQGGASGTTQYRYVRAYGLPAGCTLTLFGDHDSASLTAEGPDEAVKEVGARFVAELDEKPDAEALDHLRLVAHVAVARQQWPSAIYNAQLILAHRPGDVEALFALGVGKAASGESAAAEAALKRVVEKDARHHDAWYNLGNLALERNDVERAVSCYRSALGADPGNHPSHYQLGCALEALGRLEEALGAYRQAVASSPNPGGAWGYRGMDFTASAQEAVARLAQASP